MDGGTAHRLALVLIDIVSAHGVVILQTIWAPLDNLAYGRRLTRSETIADQDQLADRLAALVPFLDLPAAPRVAHLPPASAAA